MCKVMCLFVLMYYNGYRLSKMNISKMNKMFLSFQYLFENRTKEERHFFEYAVEMRVSGKEG